MSQEDPSSTSLWKEPLNVIIWLVSETKYGRWHWNSLLNLQVSHGKRSRFEDKKQSLCTDLSKEIPCGKSYLIELK